MKQNSDVGRQYLPSQSQHKLKKLQGQSQAQAAAIDIIAGSQRPVWYTSQTTNPMVGLDQE